MQVKCIAECSPWSILQYFQPSLSYCFPLRPLFCLFLSGRLRQVLLYKFQQSPKLELTVDEANHLTILVKKDLLFKY